MVFPVTSHNSIRTNSGEHLVDRSSRIGRSFLLRMKDGAFARGFRLRSYSSPRRRSVPAQLSPLLIFPQSQLSVAALMRMLLPAAELHYSTGISAQHPHGWAILFGPLPR